MLTLFFLPIAPSMKDGDVLSGAQWPRLYPEPIQAEMQVRCVRGLVSHENDSLRQPPPVVSPYTTLHTSGPCSRGVQ